MTRDVKWADWKMTNTAETLKIFREVNREYLVPGIEKYIITTSKPEYKMPMNVIHDEGERVRPNKIYEKSSEFTYHKKGAYADTSV